MKKVLSLLIALIALSAIPIYAVSSHPSNDGVWMIALGHQNFKIGDEYVEFTVAPYLDTKEWRTMIQLRPFAESLGASITWDDTTRTATITYNGKEISFTEGVSLPNGMGVPKLVKGHLMVPLRYTSEQLGGRVYWFEEPQVSTIIFQ